MARTTVHHLYRSSTTLLPYIRSLSMSRISLFITSTLNVLESACPIFKQSTGFHASFQLLTATFGTSANRRKALLIGINYTGTSAALRGCHNDVRNMSRFLTERYNYKAEDMVILMDDPSFAWRQQPTRQNMLEAMRWLVAGAQPNDSLFFHYSGHGGQAKDVSGDEVSPRIRLWRFGVIALLLVGMDCSPDLAF
jgi:hypothetical protein